MHCPKVRARTATAEDVVPRPGSASVEISTTSVTPGIERTSSRLSIDSTVPLIVGGRAIIVGSASGTSRSIVYFLRPVTAATTSSRRCSVPMTLNSSVGLSSATASRVTSLAAAVASSANGMFEPVVESTRPAVVRRFSASSPRIVAAASISRPRASAAATRTGV
jgi:hypothetical protein